MSHSVEHHLSTSPAEYDAGIRRFVPGYDAMLDEVIATISEHLASPTARVIDLGAGTGRAAERISRRFPEVALTLLDADASMLAIAKGRLADRPAEFVHGSFAEKLPECDIAVASLSLHHVHVRKDKRRVYRRIYKALSPGGVLVNADAAVPSKKSLKASVMKRWAAHLVANGDSETEAFDRFRDWAKEDRYFSVDEELAMLSHAGFTAIDVRWRSGPIAVFVARKRG